MLATAWQSLLVLPRADTAMCESYQSVRPCQRLQGLSGSAQGGALRSVGLEQPGQPERSAGKLGRRRTVFWCAVKLTYILAPALHQASVEHACMSLRHTPP